MKMHMLPARFAAASRRSFLKRSLLGTAGLLVFPQLVLPRRAFAAEGSANRRLQVAQIGIGRMGGGDMDGVMKHKSARIVAVCDLDSKRLGIAKGNVEKFYKKAGEGDVAIKDYHDYHEVLARPDIDAVIVSVPDHWHALVALEAVLAGKDVYCQKPLTYSIREAQLLRAAVQAKGRILQVGSQQRSSGSFRSATELVRDGHIGKIKTVQIGLGADKPSGKKPAPQQVPANLDYERWLGPAPQQPYMEGRVHPQNSTGARPGWITTEDFGLGMITNWGAHHIDIAQWGLGMEESGPHTIMAQADFMHDDLWTVHTGYHVELEYAGGIKVILDNKNEVGIKFEGEHGWVFCTRGPEKVTASDPNLPAKGKKAALRASDPKILAAKLSTGAKVWQASGNHYFNWVEAALAHKQPIAPVEQGARSLTTCALSWIGMKLKRKLTWDPVKEAFIGDDEAAAFCHRKPRSADYDIEAIAKKAGLC
jgi:predicted dehydrogenase